MAHIDKLFLAKNASNRKPITKSLFLTTRGGEEKKTRKLYGIERRKKRDLNQEEREVSTPRGGNEVVGR